MKKKLALFLLAAVVYILHQDFWNWKVYKPMIFGFIPIGLAYHALYSIVASVMMWVFVKYAWPSELENTQSLVDHSQKTDSEKP